VGIWDGRYLKLARAVRSGDLAVAKDAVLSVRIACTMIGAAQLAELAVRLEEQIDVGSFTAAVDLLAEIDVVGRLSVQALQADYVNRRSG
jgi:HPt (histidine-containing phosphotransfer) domain-containing protein